MCAVTGSTAVLCYICVVCGLFGSYSTVVNRVGFTMIHPLCELTGYCSVLNVMNNSVLVVYKLGLEKTHMIY